MIRTLWQRFSYHLGLSRPPGMLRFELDEPYAALLSSFAARENCQPEDLAAGMLCTALNGRQQAEDSLCRWRALSPREQQIAALTCLNLTNRQIAARLNLSPETVKTHLRNLLAKLELHSKAELRRALEGWDFSAWE